MKNKKTAVIFGIGGQAGSYLSELLLEKDYNVYGVIRRQSTPEHQESRISHLEDKVYTYYGDVTDCSSIDRILRTTEPDEIYSLSAQSHVRISFDIPQYTAEVNAIGVLNLLESYRAICPKARFYQASSSEMMGNSVDDDGYQREGTPMHPVSPYGIAKLFSYHMVRHYRRSYKLFASNGILFNNESPRRGSNFITLKVVKAAIRIKNGLQDKLELGNLDSYRDWGHSKDYVKAMHLILNHTEPDDFVVATGVTHSVRDICEYVFSKLDLDYKDYVVQNPIYLRPEELKYLRGDASKIRKTLGWKPTYTFETLLDEMIEHGMKVY
ncbi:hypothetical protein LCGC14_1775140 [marine sediment metagenome]|uniref:GDP-mannose 4,6-dehydratase n=1 Tax=marine sediment metagenome TaxID=412755 RepID=A0A0F9JC06_9ZZZZ